MPAQEPPEFVSSISCPGIIGPSDPVALVHVGRTETSSGDIVLRNYADPANPTTACSLGTGLQILQLIDARHVVVQVSAPGGSAYALVDLPDGRFHWFAIPSTHQFLAISPGLDEVAWVSHTWISDTEGYARALHLTTAAGDRVVADLPGGLFGRCGSSEDSNEAAYSRSGEHLYVLDQTLERVLVVLQADTTALSLFPPDGGWSLEGQPLPPQQPETPWPAQAVWSPASEKLYYRQAGDVWQWTEAGGAEVFLPGVTWSYPTISADGSHLAYAVTRADGVHHDVYLMDLAIGGQPRLIAESRTLPMFVNATQLWYMSEGQGVCGPGTDEPLIYSLADGSESSSILDSVIAAWPATSAMER